MKNRLSEMQRLASKQRRRVKKRRRKQRQKQQTNEEAIESLVDPPVDSTTDHSPLTTASTQSDSPIALDQDALKYLLPIYHHFQPKETGTLTDLLESPHDTTTPTFSTKSRKKLKKQKRLSVPMLKQSTPCPHVVETWDVTSHEPTLLVSLKAYHNTVPVPGHWRSKKSYLYATKTYVKPPFELPEAIRDTGISEARVAMKHHNVARTFKEKLKERRQVKGGVLAMDYQKLYDAFFTYPPKPRLTLHGDLYYEGKVQDDTLRALRPGQLSDSLKDALGMASGDPPPFLFNMQRHGAPPSYPSLTIPGLNAPLPAGCQWGHHPGGWGMPPMDEWNKPLYAALFQNHATQDAGGRVDKALWGEFVYNLPENDAATESNRGTPIESEDEEDQQDKDRLLEDFIIDGLASPPESLMLRK